MTHKQGEAVAQKMAEHTPGPWEYDGSGKYYHGRWIRHNGLLIAQLSLEASMHPKEQEANARLIAAAPDLLTACNHALGFAGRYHHFGGANSLMGTLRAAICKAEGEVTKSIIGG